MKVIDYQLSNVYWRYFRFALFLLLFFPSGVFGQKGDPGVNLKCGSLSAPPPRSDNPDSLVGDRFGNLYDWQTLQIAPPTEAAQADCNSGIFHITWDADFPMDKMPTVCQALGDLSSAIVSHAHTMACGDAIPTHLVEIQVIWGDHTTDPDLIQQIDVLGVGTPFYSGPADPSCTELILDRPFIKINGGLVMPFAGEIYDGRLVINSNPQNSDGTKHYNWHTDWTTTVASDEVDLYSVALHETMHILGYASRIDLPEYSLWDMILKVATDFPNGSVSGPVLVPTITTIPSCSEGTSNCWKFNTSLVADLADLTSKVEANCQNGVPDIVVGNLIATVDGANAGNIEAKLSHLSEVCNGQNNEFVMRSGFEPGMERRTVNSKEWQILCELGYEINAASYTCSGCYVIAQSDIAVPVGDMGCCSKVYHACLGETVEVLNSELLCNDISSTANDLIITRVWPAFDISANLINIVPNNSHTGWLITIDPQYQISQANFNYTVAGCDCRMHNSRFRVLFEQECPACTYNGDMCDNLLCYSDFENFHTTGGFETWLGYPFLIEGNVAIGTPDIGVVNGNHFLFMGAGSTFQGANETVTLALNKCIPPNCSLDLVMDLAGIGNSSTLAIWGSTAAPCPATDSPIIPIANNCTTSTNCDGYTYIPVCVGNLPMAILNGPANDFTFDASNHVTYNWPNTSDQNICFLTLVPQGGGAYVDNIDAEIKCEPTISCSETTVDEVCRGGIANISFQVCAPVVPECLNVTLVTPTITLPPGWSISGGNPAPFTLTDGQCQTVNVQVSVPANAVIGSMATITLSGTASGLCTEVDWTCEAEVTVIDCGLPGGDFTCGCTSGGLNINAGDDSPYYDAALGGVRYSDLENVFNYDQNNDGIISVSEHHNCIAILGRLIMDQNVEIDDCPNIQMQPCSEIVVGTNTQYPTFELKNNTIYACDIMWRGITISEHSILKASGNTIRDAQFAVTAIAGSGIGVIPPTQMSILGNTFTNNHIGVRFRGNSFTTVDHLPFTGNTFNSTANLLPVCDAPLFNYSSTLRGFAGIITDGTPITIGALLAGSLPNVFADIRNGIIGTNAVMNVYNNEFRNLRGTTIINPTTVLSSRGIGVASERGVVTVLNSTFNTVYTGVYALHSLGVTVKNNHFNPVFLGVEMRDVRTSNVSDNPEIGFQFCGVLARQVLPAGGLLSHRIANNTNMYFEPISNSFSVYTSAIDVDNPMTADIGQGRITNNIYHSNGAFSDGIRLTGAGGWDVDINHINFDAPTSNFVSNSGTGLRLTNTNENYMYANQLYELDTKLEQSLAMQLEMGTGNRYCCNTTDGHLLSSYFFGACGQTEWRVTNMNSHHLPLECAPGTVIDPQISYGDAFNVGTGTAIHSGSETEVLNSRFRVVDMNQPHWPEAISTPNTTIDWFVDQGDNADCTTPCEPVPFAPPPPDRKISMSDLTTADYGWSGSDYRDMLQWEGGRRLYERLSDYPSILSTAQASISAFYENAARNAPGKYAEAEMQAKQLSQLPEDMQGVLEQELQDLEDKRNAVLSILAELENAHTQTAVEEIYAAANQAQAEVEQNSGDLYQFGLRFDAKRNTAAIQALARTNDLPATSKLERNRKTVQQIYLQTQALGIGSLSQDQFNKVSAIAFECPLEGGSAVFAARSLYRMVEDYDFSDQEICNLSHERSKGVEKPSQASGVFLVPNPASDLVSVLGMSPKEAAEAKITLWNSNGMTCLERRLNGQDAVFSVAGLPEGLYYCRVEASGAAPTILKLTVVH